MSDLFHELVPDEFVYSVFDAMGAATRHEFQVLTKRPQRMKRLLTSYYSSRKLEPLANVWVGVSIENNQWVRRADELRETPAQIRFVSAEPLLGPLPELDLRGIDWLIVGGPSAVRATSRVGTSQHPVSVASDSSGSAWLLRLMPRCPTASSQAKRP
jgi:protein gp37